MYYYFRKWRDDGSWKRIHERLVEWVRVIEGRESSPSVGSMDSPTVPTAVMVKIDVGYDAGKKLKGRKRFTLVDTLGLLTALTNVVQIRGSLLPEKIIGSQPYNYQPRDPLICARAVGDGLKKYCPTRRE